METTDRILLLLRHAKSDYPSGVADHERPLAPRGIREAALAGEWIRTNAPTVDAVLCSTATRTRQTLARTGLTVDEAAVQYDDELYDTTPGSVISLINGMSDDVKTLLVVGHEPTMSGLALGLAQEDNDFTEEISTKYPTSSIAMLSTSEPWDRLQLGRATLIGFHVAR